MSAYNNGSYEAIDVAELGGTGAYSVDTWYRIGIEIDASGNRFRVNVNGGTFDDWKTVNGGSMTNVDFLRIQGGSTDDETN